jgi:phosphate transport system substrate-binding protein
MMRVLTIVFVSIAAAAALAAVAYFIVAPPLLRLGSHHPSASGLPTPHCCTETSVLPSTQPPSSDSSPTASPTPVTSPTATTACATGPLTLIGSTAFMPIAQAAAADYMHKCSGAQITVEDGDSAYGLTQVYNAVHANSQQAGSMIAMYDGLPSPSAAAGLAPDPIGALVFSVVAHAGLFPGSNITSDELRTIFVRHGDPNVIAVGRRGGSGSRQAFIEKVLMQDPGSPDQYGCPPPAGHTSCTAASTADVLSFVNNTSNAIGYAEVYGPIVGFPDVSVISIDDVSPDSVSDGSYHFWAVEHLYSSMQPTPLTTDFLDFLPYYIESNPLPNFIACASTPKLEADC